MSAISELQRVEAREHVQSISKKYGWVSQKTRENLARVGGLTPEAYAAIQELQESNRSLQEGWGSAIVS
jgi:methylphosphotriester-DNA--protein-cysteine methyltransferase